VNRFYRALLRLHPTSFREDYQAELLRTHEDQVRDHGRFGAIVATVADVVPNAIAAHWEVLGQDIRYAMRSLSGSRGFAVATILVTALGVGANAATFSIADFVLVRPLPFPQPDAVVRLCEASKGDRGWGCMNQLSPASYRDVREQSRSFAALGAFTGRSVNLVGAGDPIRVNGALVTSNLLPLLGVPPLYGRLFDSTGTGDSDAQTVVIGFGLWQSQFAGDPGVVGRKVSFDGTPYVVIGVMPPHFIFPTADNQVWMPLVLRPDDYTDRGNSYLDGVGRLKAGVTFEQARLELAALADRMNREHPDAYKDLAFSFFRQRDQMSPRYRLILLTLCGASLCMLLLTCANLANLSLARAAGRERELAVRAALGAGRERLVRQMLTESVLLALIGGIAGAVVAAAAVPLLSQLVPSTLPIATKPTVDVRVFVFAATFATLTGLGFGLLPALRAGSKTGFVALREGTRSGARRQRLRTALVAIEVAVSVVLLISSGLLIRAVWRVREISPGFTTDHVLTLRTTLPSPRYDDSVRRADFYDRVLTGVRALPGVQNAAYTSGLPTVLTGGIARVLLPGEVDRRDGSQNVSLRIVSSQFYKTLGIPLRRGRDISERDTPDRPLVAVVSESFVHQRWPNDDPIGKTFDVRDQRRSVVGVVGDIKVRGLERESEPQLYLPIHQIPPQTGDLYLPKDLLVHSSTPPVAQLAAIRDIVRRVDPEQPLSDVRMFSDVLAYQTVDRRTQVNVLGALALLALILSGVGIHGLLSFTVAQRDREIGVRLALGAERAAVARMIVSEGVRMAVIGVVPGVLIAYLAARAMSALLFGVSAGDPVTIGAAALVCFATAALGCVRPAFRAARIDPISALRSDY
jgi:putative ABC transport system permease protein